MKRKEITMTLNEFLDYTDSKKSFDITNLNEVLNSGEFTKFLIIGLAVGLYMINTKTAFALTPDLSGIDKMGHTFLYIVQTAGYWICLVMGIVAVLKEITKGGDNVGNIGKVILKYVISFASLYLLPTFFDIVKGCF
ncbi:MAG: hypothetical protein RSC24_06845 [Clostridium sp.]